LDHPPCERLLSASRSEPGIPVETILGDTYPAGGISRHREADQTRAQAPENWFEGRDFSGSALGGMFHCSMGGKGFVTAPPPLVGGILLSVLRKKKMLQQTL